MKKEKVVLEKEAKIGDIIEVPNGNRYLILANRRQIYMGNRELSRTPQDETVKERSEQPCTIVGHIVVEL